jgi:hypothetical protein
MRRFPDRRYYGRVASATGLPVGPLETVFRLASFLADLTTTLDEELLLRGGTALNLLHLDMPRLSVDLDLDFVGSGDADEATRRREPLLGEVERLARQAGYEIAVTRSSYAIAHRLLRYVDAHGRPASIKLDINFLDRVPVFTPDRLPLRHPYGDDVPVVMITTFRLEELAAAKIVALVRRGLARDLFDVAQIAGQPQLELDHVTDSLVVRGAAYPPPGPADYTSGAGQSVRPVEWRSQVVSLARRDMRIDLATARAESQLFLGKVLAFRSPHIDFLRALDRGALDATLLQAPAIADRVACNPGLLWRLQRGAATLEER